MACAQGAAAVSPTASTPQSSTSAKPFFSMHST